MGEWRQGKLGDFITLQRGYDLPSYNREPGNVPVVSSSGITDTHSVAREIAPGVVMGRYGTLGQIFYIKDDYWPHNTSLFVKDFKGNHPHFIYYFLQTLYYQGHSDKSSVPGLNRNDLHTIDAIFPPIEEQRAIAHILGSLDDKIETNRRMNDSLEATARALFKSWFVDFDPVHSLARGEQPPGLDADTAALFPDTFEDSELGLIPRGWKVGTLGDVIELAYGKALKADDRVEGNIPVYGSNGQVGWHNESLVSSAGIIVGRKGNPGTVIWSSRGFFPIDTTFYVVPKTHLTLRYLFYSLQTQNLPDLSADSAVPGLNRNLAYMNLMLIPSEQITHCFDEIVSSFMDQIDSNEEQTNTLAETRDALLPKLVSGEIRVDESGDFMGEIE